jgi:hypothetical protein
MKKSYFIFVFLFFASCVVSYSQDYSVTITSPSSNSVVSGIVNDKYTSNIRIDFSWTGQKSNQNNTWHFKASYEGTVSIGGVVSNPVVETDENTSYLYFPLAVGGNNQLQLQMFEVTPTNQYVYRATGYLSNIAASISIAVQNNFGSGNINVNGNPNISSGASFNLYNASLGVNAIENQIDNEGYNRIWNTNSSNQSHWVKIQYDGTTSTLSPSSGYTYTPTNGDNGASLRADLRKQCHLTSNARLIYGGITYSAGSNITLIDGVPSTIAAEATFPSSDYLLWQFTSWADDNSTTNPRIFTISSHTTVNINASVVRPTNGYRGMNYSANPGENITINWSEHPNSSVTQYQIWRRVRHSGVTGDDELIATVNRGTTTYTDNSYLYTSSYTDDLLWYDVRAYYSPNSSYADADFVAVYGRQDLSNKVKDNNIALKQIEVAPTEYSLGSYPNPFNPTTVIRYTMPEAGQVSLKIYNVLSQEVANLVESNQSAGVHQINFNASHLPTGIYIARLQAGAKVMTSKLQLVK